MTLTDHLPRLLAGIAFGAAALVPAVALAPATATADPGDGPGNVTTATTDPCIELGTCPPEDECDPETEICDLCQAPCTPPPECDPEVEDCDVPECDPEVEECDDPVPGDDPDPDPEPVDPPIVARPTFTG